MSSLRFTPQISRYANLYFFVQNLSEWHFSNRKEHNRVWREELHFSNNTESCIKQFKEIHERYTFGDKYLGRPFFLFEDPWPKIKHLVGEVDFVKIKNIFVTLEPYFDTIYSKDKAVLEEWTTIIAKPEFKTNASYINNALARFYGCKPYKEICTIYLLLSTPQKNGGTAGTISDHAITLELSRTPIRSEKQVLNILWHELIHLYFRNFTLYPLLEKLTNRNWEIMGKIDELMASSLLPNGLLKQETLTTINEKMETPGIFNARIPSEEITCVQKLIYPYLQEEKTMDSELMKKIYMELRKEK